MAIIGVKLLTEKDREKLIDCLVSDKFMGSRYQDVRANICRFIKDAGIIDEKIIKKLNELLKDEYVRRAANEAL